MAILANNSFQDMNLNKIGIYGTIRNIVFMRG